MGGLFHDFFVLSVAEYPYRGFGKLYNSPEGLRIHDDHLRYLYDSLLWIPTFNPAINMIEHNGLNLYGQTVIKQDGALIAQKVFKAWSGLFRCGPEIIVLTGNYTIYPDRPDEGDYKKLSINRNEFVEKLETLAEYCDKVMASEEREFIFHLGI